VKPIAVDPSGWRPHVLDPSGKLPAHFKGEDDGS